MQRLTLILTFAVLLLAVQPLSGQAPQSPSQEMKQMLEEMRESYAQSEADRNLMRELLTISNDKSMVSELQIVDEQLDKVKALSKEYLSSIREDSVRRAKRSQEMQKLLAAGEHEKIMKMSLERQKESIASAAKFGKPLREILLPHQIERIEQLKRQKSLKYRSKYYGMFGMPLHLADELDLTEQEKRKLEKETEEADKKMRSEIAKLNKELMKKILNSLPKEKQEAYGKLVGDYYDEDAARRKRFNRPKILPPADKAKAKKVEGAEKEED